MKGELYDCIRECGVYVCACSLCECVCMCVRTLCARVRGVLVCTHTYTHACICVLRIWDCVILPLKEPGVPSE